MIGVFLVQVILFILYQNNVYNKIKYVIIENVIKI